jgi:membrane protease YdiL (CAAX protease family)
MQSDAFEAYRASPPRPIELWRLLVGMLIIAACWLGVSVLFVIAGSVASDGNLETFGQTRPGTLGLFATFAGIWLGVWLAMRFLHREPLRNLFGVGGRVATGDFWRGFATVVLTSLLSEVLIYLVWPEFGRSPISLNNWLIYLIPVTLLCLVQTSSEEVLFRGYLMRGLANRFRSPWIWALLPALAFLALHLTPQMTLNDLLLVLFTIGALTAALVAVVYVTGNLGAAFGMHMANNLFAFLLVSHQSDFGQFSLLHGAMIENDLATQQLVTLAAISLVCVGLTVALLLHRASPLRLRGV